MADDHLTLQETADRLGVHYMTVYRWVRTGLLPATKDGGIWRVRPEDADARAAPTEPAPTDGGTGGRPTARRRVDHGLRLSDRLLAADEGGSIRVLDDALAGGLEAAEVSLELIPAAMRRIGDLWEHGDATVADEHQASVIATRLVGRLTPHFRRRGRKRGTILLGTVAGDQHGLPVSLVAGPLRGRGHRVVELGANTPAPAFADAMARETPVMAVGVFSAFAQPDVVAEAVAAVHGADPDTRVVVGGAGIADADQAVAMGADAYSTDGHAAIDALTGATPTGPHG